MISVSQGSEVHRRISVPEKPLKAHIVVMVDYFTKAAEFAVSYSKTPAAVANAFYYTWICRYFVPSHVTSDNGKEFDAEFVHLLATLGIEHVLPVQRTRQQMVF
jgi:molybdopterin biosynthesis enzyme